MQRSGRNRRPWSWLGEDLASVNWTWSANSRQTTSVKKEIAAIFAAIATGRRLAVEPLLIEDPGRTCAAHTGPDPATGGSFSTGTYYFTYIYYTNVSSGFYARSECHSHGFPANSWNRVDSKRLKLNCFEYLLVESIFY